MIFALLNGRAGTGKTTLALHLAAEWAVRGERVVLIDADPRQDAIRWHEARIRAGLSPLFRVLPAAPKRLDRRVLGRLARRTDRLIIDGPSGAAALSSPALLASDLVVIPTAPSPADAGAVLEMVGLLMDARRCRPGLPVRFVFNRRAAPSDAERETAEMRIEYEPALLDAMVCRHPLFVEAVRSGRPVRELDADSAATREIAELAAEIETIPVASRQSGSFADRILPRFLKPWIAPSQRRALSECPLDALRSDAAARPAVTPLDGKPS